MSEIQILERNGNFVKYAEVKTIDLTERENLIARKAELASIDEQISKFDFIMNAINQDSYSAQEDENDDDE